MCVVSFRLGVGRLRQVALPPTKACRGFQPEKLSGDSFSPFIPEEKEIEEKNKEV